MYINIDLKLPEHIQEQIKEETIKTAVEQLQNSQEFSNVIRSCVKGIIKANINEVLQGKDFREFLSEKIAKEIGMKQAESEE